MATTKRNTKHPILGTKIGRLHLQAARAAHVRCADIYLMDTYISHVARRHLKEIERFGIKVEEYIRMIVSEYNQVRKGSGDSILLVVFKEDIHHVAAISLCYETKKGVWEVRSAQPRRTRDVETHALLWRK